MDNPTLFDAVAAERGKETGMSEAAASRSELLAIAQQLAIDIAKTREDRCCDADDVQAGMVQRGFSVFALGNAAGSIFKGKCWEWTGVFVKSERAHSHSNLLRKWRYVG